MAISVLGVGVGAVSLRAAVSDHPAPSPLSLGNTIFARAHRSFPPVQQIDRVRVVRIRRPIVLQCEWSESSCFRSRSLPASKSMSSESGTENSSSSSR